MPYKDIKPIKTKTTVKGKQTSGGKSPWLNIDPINPVVDIYNPNKGAETKSQAPNATKARSGPYVTKVTPPKGSKKK